MLITIICVVVGLSMSVCRIIENLFHIKNKTEEKRIVQYTSDFSVSDYLERMKKYSIELMLEKTA